MSLRSRLDRVSVRQSIAVEVWYQDMSGSDAYTSRAHSVTLTQAQLNARPYEGTRILVEYVDSTRRPHQ